MADPMLFTVNYAEISAPEVFLPTETNVHLTSIKTFPKVINSWKSKKKQSTRQKSLQERR